ncbi:TPA: RNA polymerase sporulation sigma factor SigE [Clostridioides difficile]|nr:RNA polymerase sporulation sigma factor SigE [Clostridioides difficile]
MLRLKERIISFITMLGIKLKIIKPKGIYYMGGANILPPPLKPEEEMELLQKLETDESVKSILIERNLRLVVYISRKFENTGIDVEDLISIGTIGLIKAVNTFKLNKNIKLATYASRCIENEILMYLRKNNKKKTEVSFDEPLNIDLDGNELLLSDVLGTENDEIYKTIEEEIDRDLLVMALDRLSDREKQIMELRFGLIDKGIEKTQKEVAGMLGISQSYISRLEKKIISRLQKEMKKFV